MYEAKCIELERAQRDWQRNKLLLEKKAIARQAGDLYRTRAVSLAAEVAAAKARYEQVSAPACADEVRRPRKLGSWRQKPAWTNPRSFLIACN